jgi:Caspase domain
VGRAPTRLGAPEASRAVLLGIDDYTGSPDLDSLPAVVDNVDRLAELLTAPQVWGLPPENCTVLHNPVDPLDALDVIHEAAVAATDTFLFYYAGHGLLSPTTAELLLALPGTSSARLYRALRYDDLRGLFNTVCGAEQKVAILDCCYSGRTVTGAAGSTSELADQSMAEGMYVLTAASESVAAWAPPGERYTAFTGELIRAVEQGLPGGDEVLQTEPLYQWLRQEMAAKGRPVPQQRARTDGRSIALVRNLSGLVPAADSQPLVGPDAGLGTAGPDAGAAGAFATASYPAEYADPAGYVGPTGYTDPTAYVEPATYAADVTAPVDPTGPPDPLELARQELGLPPGELTGQSALAVAEYLDSIGLVGAAFDVYAQAGEVIGGNWPADRVATLLRRMVDSGAEAQAQLLFDSAAVAVEGYISSCAYLVTALAGLGLTGQADALIDLFAVSHEEQDLISFANYLKAGKNKGLAERALLAAALAEGPREVLSLADQLRRHSRDREADALLGALIATRPATAMGLLDELRAQGRPADLTRLLHLITHSSPDVCGQVVESLWRGGQDGAITQVLSAAPEWPLPSLVRLRLSPADPHHSGALADLLSRALVNRPTEEFIEAFRVFELQGQAEYGEVLAGLLFSERTELVPAVCHGLGRLGLVKSLGLVLFRYAAVAGPDELAQLVAGLWHNGSDGSSAVLHGALTVRGDSGAVLAAFQRAGIGDLADRYLEYLADTLTPSDLVRLTVILTDQDRVEELNLLLGRCARRSDYHDLATALHRVGQHAQAYYLAERREEVVGRAAVRGAEPAAPGW